MQKLKAIVDSDLVTLICCSFFEFLPRKHILNKRKCMGKICLILRVAGAWEFTLARCAPSSWTPGNQSSSRLLLLFFCLVECSFLVFLIDAAKFLVHHFYILTFAGRDLL
jgi:hypothetical protein